MDGGDTHNRSTATLLDQRHGKTRALIHATQVGINHPIVVLGSNFIDGLHKTDTGVVDKHIKTFVALLRRLEVGLLVVDLEGDESEVEVILHPLPYQRQRSKNRERQIISEMAGRSGDFNEGGSVGKELMTAYRESAIYIACALDEFGPQTAVQLRKRGAAPKARSIMYSNFYGWFDRIAVGVYSITPKGCEELKRYTELAETFRAQLR